MTKGSSDPELAKVLSSIDKQLKSIQKTLKSFEGRIGALESTVEQKVQSSGENPLIFSRVLMGTVEVIREYEVKHGHG